MDASHAPVGAGIATADCRDEASTSEGPSAAASSGGSGAARGAWRVVNELGSSLSSTSPRALRLSLYGSIAVTCAVAALMLWTGPNPLRATGHDLLLPLDAAWRVSKGQVPHNDFYSPLGPAFSYWAALWMGLLGPVASIVHYSVLGHGVLLASAAFFVGQSRLSGFVNWIFTSVVLLLAIAPYPVGWPPEALDTAMVYNRLAFAIVTILVVEAALPSVAGATRAAPEALLAGVLLGLLPLLKLNFAVIGAGAEALVLLYPGHALKLHRRLLWLGLGMAIPALLFFVVLGVSWHSFMGDMAMARRVFEEAHPNTARAIATLSKKVRPAIVRELWPTGVGVWLVIATGSLANLRRGAALGIIYCFLLAADLAMGISNTQLPTLTLLPLMPLFALETVRRSTWLEPVGAAPATPLLRPAWWFRRGLNAGITRGVVALSATLLLVLGVGLLPLRGLHESVEYALHPLAGSRTLVGHGFERAVPYPSNDSYPLIESDGIDLLREQLRPGDKLVTLDFSNPFNFALELQPARGDALWWHEGKTFSDGTHPAPERVFGEADWVIVAKRWEHQVMPAYGGYIGEHFDEAASNASWSLYRRHSMTAP